MTTMNRRFVIKAGIAAGLTGGSLSIVGCTKKTIVQWAGTVVMFLEQALPYFEEFLPSAVPLLQKVIAVAKLLQDALSAESETAIDLINQLIAPNGLFQQILNEVALIPEAQRRIVAGILAVVGIALNIIATAIANGAAGAPPKIVAGVRSRNVAGSNVIDEAAKSDVLLKALESLKK